MVFQRNQPAWRSPRCTSACGIADGPLERDQYRLRCTRNFDRSRSPSGPSREVCRHSAVADDRAPVVRHGSQAHVPCCCSPLT